MAVFCLFLFSISSSVFANNSLCVSTHFDEESFIDYVIDGDTVILKDGRHVRLIGIDTPEIFHDGQAPQPGAIKAREWLQSIFDEDKRVKLVYDAERFDRHGRTLAHLYLQDGRNIQALLLQEGLATPLFFPPSVGMADCYADSTQAAKKSRRGLWSMANYQPVSSRDLKQKDIGYRLVRGQIKYISESKSSIWLNFETDFAVRIVKSDLKYFNRSYFDELTGKFIEAGGRIYFQNGQLRMRIRYPLDLTIMNMD